MLRINTVAHYKILYKIQIIHVYSCHELHFVIYQSRMVLRSWIKLHVLQLKYQMTQYTIPCLFCFGIMTVYSMSLSVTLKSNLMFLVSMETLVRGIPGYTTITWMYSPDSVCLEQLRGLLHRKNVWYYKIRDIFLQVWKPNIRTVFIINAENTKLWNECLMSCSDIM
jgi:hypothetical protein